MDDIKPITSRVLNISPRALKKFTLTTSHVRNNLDSASTCVELCGDVEENKVNANKENPKNEHKLKAKPSEISIQAPSSKQFSPVDLTFENTFPYLTDSLLQKLDLDGNCTKQGLTHEDIENMFAYVGKQILLDSNKIKDKLEELGSLCEKQHKKCFYLIKDISVRLRDHKCIGAADPINPVFVLLEDVRFLLQEIIQSAGQLGILSCENRMTKCWNLVLNYMKILKMNSELKSASRYGQCDCPRQCRLQFLTLDPSTQNFTLKLSLQSLILWKGKGLRKLKLIITWESVLMKFQKDKGVNTSQKFLTDQEMSTVNKELNNLNEPMDVTNIHNSRCRISLCCKKVILFILLSLISLIFATTLIHWHCKMSSEDDICLLGEFIKKRNIWESTLNKFI